MVLAWDFSFFSGLSKSAHWILENILNYYAHYVSFTKLSQMTNEFIIVLENIGFFHSFYTRIRGSKVIMEYER